MQRGRAVLVDTNIIIEAVRAGCWTAIKVHFSVHTVEKCREEARTGDIYRSDYVRVDEAELRDRIEVHAVSDAELAALGVKDPESMHLDLGERHLWAHALGRRDDWIAACCDQGALNAAVRLGWRDRLVSLEALAAAAGAKRAVRQLKPQYSAVRLSKWLTDAILRWGLK
jgi:hypothetical protein